MLYEWNSGQTQPQKTKQKNDHQHFNNQYILLIMSNFLKTSAKGEAMNANMPAVRWKTHQPKVRL